VPPSSICVGLTSSSAFLRTRAFMADVISVHVPPFDPFVCMGQSCLDSFLSVMSWNGSDTFLARVGNLTFVSFGVFGHFGHVQPTFVRVRHLHGDGTFDAFPPERRETSWGRLDDRPHHVSPGSLHVLPHLMERVGSTHVLQRNPTQDQKRRRVRTSQEGGGVWQSMPASKLLGRTSRRSTRHSR